MVFRTIVGLLAAGLLMLSMGVIGLLTGSYGAAVLLFAGATASIVTAYSAWADVRGDDG
jgi:energy-converting hydrogenase Eha subunit A